MAKLFDAVSRFKKIEDVTSTKDDVPPVYLMDEIAELCREPDQAQSVAEHVNRRLGNKSPIVKWKALKLVRHLCVKGCSQFQRAMQKFASSIRDLVHYKGDPDPFTGDAPNQRVRDLAKEVVELLYSSSNSSSAGGGGSALQGRIQGFGSSMPPAPGATSTSTASVSSSSTFTSGSRMMGFGNAAYNNPPPPAPGGGSSTLSNGGGGTWGKSGAYGASGHSSSSHSEQNTYISGSGGMGASLTGGGGGTFGRGGSEYTAPATSHLNYHANNTPSNVLGSEEQLVEDMCAPGGMRPMPDAQDLRKFVEAASNMDGLKLAELMMTRLGSSQWQVVLRTLCALEAVLQHGMTQACGEIAVMFQSDPSLVRAHITHAQQTVRERAAKCLKLLVNEDVQLPAHQLRKPAGAAPDMLAGEQPVSAPAVAAVPVVAAAASTADPFDLLGDLTTPAQPAATRAAAVPAVPVAAPVPAFDPFAGMPGMGPVPTTVPAVQAAPAPAAPKAPAPLEDLLSSMTVSAGGQVGLGQQGGAPGVVAGFPAQSASHGNTGLGAAWPSIASTPAVPAATHTPAVAAAPRTVGGPLDLGFDLLAAPAVPQVPAAGAGAGFGGLPGVAHGQGYVAGPGYAPPQQQGYAGIPQQQPFAGVPPQQGYAGAQPQGYGAPAGGVFNGFTQPLQGVQSGYGAGPVGSGFGAAPGAGAQRPMPGAPMGGQWAAAKPVQQSGHDAAFDFVRDAFK